MLNLQDIKQAQEKVHRRLAILEQAVNEYDKAVERLIKQANTEVISRKLKIVDIARLLDVSPRTITRWGANECRSYVEIHDWVKVNRPEKLSTLEKNYQILLKELD